MKMMGEMWAQLGSVIASLMFVYAIVQQYFPYHLQGHVERYTQKLVGYVYPYIQITFDEYTNEFRKRNEVYCAIQSYLSTKSCRRAKRLKAHDVKDSKSLVLGMDDNEEVTDEFEGVKVWWASMKQANKKNSFSFFPEYDEKKHYKLTFHRRHREIIMRFYLDYVRKEGKAIAVTNRQRKLYINNTDKGTKWSHVVFEHPATFETMAMDPKKKEEIVNDLVKFSKGKEYYAKIGKPWKRGYLLYGPPGTGKSTMIAAMSNLMNYDVYDLELTVVKDNTELRKLLIDITGKSIVVIEDIDCSLDLTGQRKKKKEKDEADGEEKDPIRNMTEGAEDQSSASKVTLSGLLNFIDGIWSACGGERLIVFTTNYVDKLDPALIRRGRMDKHIELSYCCYEAFKVLAKNYLDLDSHQLFETIERLLGETYMTPADVAENLMPKSAFEDADSCLKNLIKALVAAKEEMDPSSGISEENVDPHNVVPYFKTSSVIPARPGKKENQMLACNIWYVASLRSLDLSNSPITSLPESIGSLHKLQTLYLSHCRRLTELPESIGSLHTLVVLSLTGCVNLVMLPASIGSLHKLQILELKNCIRLTVLPKSIGSLHKLHTLVLSGCTSLIGLSDSLGSLHELRTLKLSSGLSIVGLPEGIKELTELQYLDVTDCKKLKLLPITDFGNESTLKVAYSYSTGTKDKDHILCHGSELSDVNLEQEHMPTRTQQEDAKEICHVDLEENHVYSVQVAVEEHDESLLEHLFMYCSLFPSGYEFRKDELVQLWIAEGFIGENQKESMEDRGSAYFNSLVGKGYFVYSRSDFGVDFDLMFSVPIYNPSNLLYKVDPIKLSVLENTISGGDYFRAVDGNLDRAFEMTRHMSLICDDIDEMTFGNLKKFKHLRTLLLLSAGSGYSSIKHIPHNLFLSLKLLTTLNLSQTLIYELPSSIRNVKELRYLDVSNTPITRLPESIDALHNLQTIKLRGCINFFQLPRGMKNLTNLRHVDLDIIGQLNYMPAHLGDLTKLQTLSAFLVGSDDGCRIGELKNLNDLKGTIRISRLENVLSKEEAEEASLAGKKCLHRLDLQWSNLSAENTEEQEKILECLEPHSVLKELQIQNYGGSRLPTWISSPSFVDLVVITLYRCGNCKLLPSIGQLPALKFLSIIEMNEVEEINHQFFRSGPDDGQAFPAFPKLERLEVEIMLNLKEWKEVQIGEHLPSLLKLTVDSCPKLVTLPSLSCLKSLKHLEFRHCPNLLPRDGLPTPVLEALESFVIIDCPKLKEWCCKREGEDWSKIANVPSVWFDHEEPRRESGTMQGNFECENAKCQLLHWYAFDVDEVVAEGKITSIDPRAKVHHMPLGRDCWEVWVEAIIVPNVSVYRTTDKICTLNDALGSTVAWPKSCIKLL